MSKVNGKLTPKQQRFVEEYVIDWNATQAAIRAGYSKRTADVIGIENLGKPRIAEEIAIYMEQKTQEADVKVSDIIQGMLRETEPQDDGSSATRISAWSWLGKYKRMWEQDQKNQQNTQINIHLTEHDLKVL
jgi:phage terminase small subunit